MQKPEKVADTQRHTHRHTHTGTGRQKGRDSEGLNNLPRVKEPVLV